MPTKNQAQDQTEAQEQAAKPAAEDQGAQRPKEADARDGQEAKVEARREEVEQANAERKERMERLAQEQVAARNREALGRRRAGVDATATTPHDPDLPELNAPLQAALERGYIGGQPYEERRMEEETARSFRDGLVGVGHALDIPGSGSGDDGDTSGHEGGE